MDVLGYHEAMESLLDVAAMAAIVHDLLAGGLSLLQDAQWLRERAEAAGLGLPEYEALEALRARLLQGGTTLPSGGEVWWK
jgi:hypothetical protein